MIVSKTNWSNKSVKEIAKGDNPIEILVSKIRAVILDAMDKGYNGPPFDPFDLALNLGYSVIPSSMVKDARTVPSEETRFRIEFNPNMPQSRINFSIAHEIAHTFFPDCSDEIRHRLPISSSHGNTWELELLCNIGAAEILMPIGSFPNLKDEALTLSNLLRIRKEFRVSTEAVLLRIARLTDSPCCVFAASRDEQAKKSGNYRFDYLAISKTFPYGINKSNVNLPTQSVITDCIAIGLEAKGKEVWNSDFGEFEVECIGIPPFPGKSFPRVVGIVKPATEKKNENLTSIKYAIGDVTCPNEDGNKIIAHVVNDTARKWGGRGVAKYISQKWPDVYNDFDRWRKADILNNFRLGECRLFKKESDLYVFSMICQHGFGNSNIQRIQYHALDMALDRLSKIASELNATVHMPRIGCGYGGGDWSVIAEIIENNLLHNGIKVTVYDLYSR